MMNAQDNVSISLTSINSAISNLTKALSQCEKKENKDKIQSALDCIHKAYDFLCEYKD